MPPIWSIVRAPSRNSNRRGTMSTAMPASRHVRSTLSSSSWWAREKATITRSTRPCGDELAGASSSAPSRGSPRCWPSGRRRRSRSAAGRARGGGQAVDEPRATSPEPTISVRCSQLGGAVDVHAGAGAGAARRASPSRRSWPARRWIACGASTELEQAEQRPGQREAGEHELGRLADAARPAAQVLAGVEAAEERRDRPDDGRAARRRRRAATGGSPANEPPMAPAAAPATSIGRDELPAEVLAAAPARLRRDGPLPRAR